MRLGTGLNSSNLARTRRVVVRQGRNSGQRCRSNGIVSRASEGDEPKKVVFWRRHVGVLLVAFSGLGGRNVDAIGALKSCRASGPPIVGATAFGFDIDEFHEARSRVAVVERKAGGILVLLPAVDGASRVA